MLHFKIYFMTFFKILKFYMVLGLPTPAWPKCGPRSCGTLPISITIGHIETLALNFVAKKFVFWPKISKLWEKIGKYRSKIPQRLLMVAMVTLAAGRRPKMALGLQKFFEILALFRGKSFFFQFNCYYKTIIKLF